ncbi:hypothetical protein HMPREF3203_02930 [Proteus mirabilis]|nr:hypothetical protein HMPREF3203_02930 [Proteus mirabilis]
MIRLSIAKLSFSILGYNEEKFLYFSLLTHYIIKFYQITSAKLQINRDIKPPTCTINYS